MRLQRQLEKLLLKYQIVEKISMAQRRKAFVLLGYISAWWGYTPLEANKEITKQMFNGHVPCSFDTDFSLSNCSVEVARLYITYLIDFCILHVYRYRRTFI